MQSLLASPEIIDHNPGHDERLFREADPNLFNKMKSLGDLSIEYTPPAPGEIHEKLDDIVHYAKVAAVDLGGWRYPNDSEDTHRVFTPWFGTKANTMINGSVDQVDTRLHVCPARNWAPQPIMHVEKRLRIFRSNRTSEHVFAGQELVGWTPEKVTGGISIGGKSRHHFNLDNGDDPYAFDALKAIRQAHQFFVASKVDR